MTALREVLSALKKAGKGNLARRVEAALPVVINGRKFTLSYTKQFWIVEYMADGSDIPATREFGSALNSVVWRMPTGNDLLGKLPRNYTISTEAIRARAHLRADDTGEEIRSKILQGYESFLAELADDPNVQSIAPELRKKLVWKQKK